MLIKDMRPNTEYATCDGRLVVTDKADKMTRGWYHYTEYATDPNTQQRVQINRVVQSNPLAAGNLPDPWADCNVVGPSRASVRIHVKNGVRVTEFAYDRNGKRTGKGVERVMLPSDIPGTWSDYVLLHADKIEARFRKAELEEQQRTERKRIEDALRKGGIKIRPDRYVYADDRRNTQNTAYVSIGNDGRALNYAIHLDGTVVEELLVKAGILPKPAAAARKRAPRKAAQA